MITFSKFIWACIQTWNCINTRNPDKLYEKSNVVQFLYRDKLNFILFMSNYMTWTIYLGSVYNSVYNNPERN